LRAVWPGFPLPQAACGARQRGRIVFPAGRDPRAGNRISPSLYCGVGQEMGSVGGTLKLKAGSVLSQKCVGKVFLMREGFSQPRQGRNTVAQDKRTCELTHGWTDLFHPSTDGQSTQRSQGKNLCLASLWVLPPSRELFSFFHRFQALGYTALTPSAAATGRGDRGEGGAANIFSPRHVGAEFFNELPTQDIGIDSVPFALRPACTNASEGRPKAFGPTPTDPSPEGGSGPQGEGLRLAGGRRAEVRGISHGES
jgi:hypothetical protein